MGEFGVRDCWVYVGVSENWGVPYSGVRIIGILLFRLLF